MPSLGGDSPGERYFVADDSDYKRTAVVQEHGYVEISVHRGKVPNFSCGKYR